MKLETVTPRLEYCHKRFYARKGCKIGILNIKDHKLLFTLELPTEELANAVMDDLYYGEYTGA